MKPISVTMQAFGCYLDRTAIDFTRLGENPLFLITGPTGGGKTTILDAMCFALYCRATGGRRSWGSMICTAALQEAETMVEFVFSVGGGTYRFFRSQKRYAARGTGAIKIKEEHSCYRMVDSQWELMVTGAESRVREQAERLLGLDCEQFSQVMVLPQGDFLKLLLANSRDKAQMFQTLFATERWSRAALNMKRMAEEVQQRANELTVSKKLILEREEAATAEELEQKCTASEQELKACRESLTRQQKELEEQNTALSRASTLWQKFESADTLKKERELLKQKEPEILQKKETLKMSRLVKGVLPYFQAFQAAGRDTAAKETFYADALKKRRQTAQERDTALASVPAAKKLKQEGTALTQRLSSLETALGNAKRLLEIQEQLKEKDELLKRQAGEQQKLQAALQDAQNRRREGTEYMRGVQEQNQRLPKLVAKVEALVKNDAAAALASGLQEGTPCPVCGAVHHPSPALPSEQLRVAQAELEQAKKAGETLVKCEKRLQDLERIQEQARSRLEQGREQLSQLERESAALKAAADELSAALGDLRDRGRLENEIAAVKRSILQKTEQAEQIEQCAARSQSASAAAEASAEAAERALQEAHTLYQKAKGNFESYAAEAGLKPETDFSSYALTPQQESELEKELNDYDASCKGKAEQLDRLEAEIVGLKKPDLDAAKAIQSEAQLRYNETAQKAGSLSQRVESARKSLSRLTALIQAGAGLEEQYSRTSRLASLLSGKTGLKIPIHQFVLGIMLDDILSCANTFFSTFSNGRYSLSRVNGASGGNALGGLDLQVFDAYSGGVRGVETLSGGELFLASLSLAFGLSDVVQSYSGGVHLDSIFIDEGFGSLDQDTLDTAMKTLLQIQQSGRTVGIISHVSELKSRIACQIVVSRAEDGSSTAQVIGPV